MSTALLAASVVFLAASVQALIIGAWRAALAERADDLPPGDDPLPGISVIVPARDEEGSIAAVLQDLHAQRYPRDLVEVIVVDDGSTDRTRAIAEAMVRAWPQLRVVWNKGEGKKAAITTGIGASANGVIVLTDADVRFGPDRLSAIAAAMRAGKPDLLILPVWTDGRGSLGVLQEEEQAALLGMAMGSAIGGSPTLAYGANLAFKREAFLGIGGYGQDRFASGDDLFLLRRMRARGKPIGALFHADALVTTEATTTWRAFFAQRLRWAGKMRGAIGAFSLLGLLGLLWPWALVAVTARFSFTAAMGEQGFHQLLFIAAAWALWLVPIAGLVRDIRRVLARPGNALITLLALAAFSVYAPMIALSSLVVRPGWKGRRM